MRMISIILYKQIFIDIKQKVYYTIYSKSEKGEIMTKIFNKIIILFFGVFLFLLGLKIGTYYSINTAILDICIIVFIVIYTIMVSIDAIIYFWQKKKQNK